MDATVNEILSLIQSKNRCLVRLMEVTQNLIALSPEEMLESASTPGGANARPNAPIDLYDRERTSTVKTLELIDREITQQISLIDGDTKKSANFTALKQEMERSEQLLGSIFGADDVVFQKISQIQRDLAKEIAESRKSREVLAKFRSQQNNPSGEEVDTTL